MMLWLQVPDVDVEVGRLASARRRRRSGRDDALGPAGGVAGRPRRRAHRAGRGARRPSDPHPARLTALRRRPAVHVVSSPRRTRRAGRRADRRAHPWGDGPVGQLRPHVPGCSPTCRSSATTGGATAARPSSASATWTRTSTICSTLIAGRPAVLVGHSIGGVIALVAARAGCTGPRRSARGRRRCPGPSWWPALECRRSSRWARRRLRADHRHRELGLATRRPGRRRALHAADDRRRTLGPASARRPGRPTSRGPGAGGRPRIAAAASAAPYDPASLMQPVLSGCRHGLGALPPAGGRGAGRQPSRTASWCGRRRRATACT